MRELAKEYVKVYESFDPGSLYAYSPAIIKLENGRLLATIDIRDVDSKRKNSGDYSGWYKENERSSWLGKIFSSDDKGETWQHRGDFPFLHARPFVCGDNIYILGHAGDLKIIKSSDNGDTWGEVHSLTEGQSWHQAPCNVCYANGCIYLVMERVKYDHPEGWKVIDLAPVLMRGKVCDDLTKRDNWTFASELTYRDIREKIEPNYFGVPFFKYDPFSSITIAGKRKMHPAGILETNVVQFYNPEHIWHDSKGKTFHLLARTHTGWVNHAALLKVVEHEDGTMETMLEKVPSGQEVFFINMPGGQMKFHILYDEVSKLYWLLGSQTTDSMIDINRMDPERFDIPNNERNRLVLHFSRNCVDWCFAGVVAIGADHKQSRHYASMCIDGEDLCVLSRSGDEHVCTAHDTNIITFHRIENFRSLIY